MAIIYMVRHGRAAAGFDAHHDPGLDDTGHRQATTAAQALSPLGPIAIYSSPLARARETAMPLSQRWGVEMVIEPRVAEIPSPMEDLAQRSVWLRGVMGDRWANLDEDLRLWRASLVDCLLDLKEDSVVFCHFIAINVAVGAATNDERMISFRPDNASITRLANADGVLRVVELGREGETKVN